MQFLRVVIQNPGGGCGVQEASGIAKCIEV